MSHFRMVLVEHLGAPGAAEADARDRVSLLQHAGFEARALVCDPTLAEGRNRPAPAAGRAPRFGAGRAGLAALSEAAQAHAPHQVVIASPAHAVEAIARALPAGLALRWWPTAFDPGARGVAPCAALDAEGCALAWSAGEPLRGARQRLPLWDGDYVLAPLPLAGRGGAQVIESFARAAADADALDLVVLGDAQPEFEALARRFGVGTRVHFAGAATRDAEFAWWNAATVAVFAGESPFSAGMVWRALECGCPLLVAGDAPLPAALRAWLDGRGCLVGARAGGTHDLAAALAAALDRAPASRVASSRGPALACAQHEALPARLAAVLGREAGARAA